MELTRFLSSIPQLSDLGSADIEVLASGSDITDYKDGDVIKRVGEIGRF
ncbi:MAG: hypothetical protein HQK89_01410, partial [Nitrospirae bacterium]|nr:hypothetical protein [Nitrospirota bacterium]